MPTNIADHNYDAVDGQRHFTLRQSNQSNPAVHSLGTATSISSPPPPPPLSPPLQILPATTYRPPSATSSKRLCVSTALLDPTPHRPYRPIPDESSPDPREYYLEYNDPFHDAGIRGLQNDLNTELFPSTISENAPVVSSVNSPPSRSPPPPPSQSLRYHSASKPRTTNHHRRATEENYTVSPRSSKQRHSSLKDLVNKFNQTPDQIPPRPPPVPRFHSPPSRSTSPYQSDFYSASPDTAVPEAPKRGRDFENTSRHALLNQYHKQQSLAAANKKTSGHAGASVGIQQTEQSPPRRPLFGEIVPESPHYAALAKGRQLTRRRRGSDGSLHASNYAFLDLPSAADSGNSGISPSSPTAWYLGYAPTSETVRPGSSPGSHRRSRSDISTRTSDTFVPDFQISGMGVASYSARLRTPNSNVTGSRPNPSSQSRIPFPSGHLSNASDSGNSTHSSRVNPAPGRHAVALGKSSKPSKPVKRPSALPLATSKTPSPTTSRQPTGERLTSPGRSRTKPHPRTPVKSPTLKAYISAPPAKKSPPLRSSRPRQPVSAATTTSSRSKVVDRISSFQEPSSTKRPQSRQQAQRLKRLPELGSVDFAARRQKIQQAFNRSVEERARKEGKVALRTQQSKQKQSGPAEEPQDLQTNEEEFETAKKRNGAKNGEQDRQQLEDDEQSTPVQKAPGDTTVTKGVEKGQAESQEQGKNNAKEDPITEAQDTHAEGNTQQSNRYSVDVTEDQETFVTPDEGRSPELTSLEPGTSFVAIVSSSMKRAVLPTKEMSKANGGELVTETFAENTMLDVAPSSAVTEGTDTTAFDPEPQNDSPQLSLTSHETMLSQILRLRESSPSRGSSSDEEHDDYPSDHDDKESIQIVLRRSRYIDGSMSNAPGADRASFYADDDPQRWSIGSWDSSIQERGSRRTSPRRGIRTASTYDESPLSTAVFANDSSPTTQQTSFSQALAERYGGTRAADVVARSRLNELTFRHSFLGSSARRAYTNLAKQGGWDSKRVTQLYLQELARGGFGKAKSRQVESTSDGRKMSEQSSSSDAVKDGDGLNEEPVVVPASDTVPRSDYAQHRPSLMGREDWEQASFTDWMHLAKADATDNAHAHAGKGLEPILSSPVDPHDNPATPRISVSDVSTNQSTVGGLGVSVSHDSIEGKTMTGPSPPPKPEYDPPPPPPPKSDVETEAAEQSAVAKPSPSVYSEHPSPGPTNAGVNTRPSGTTSVAGSESSSLHRVSATPSPYTLASSATSASQVRSSADQSSIEVPMQKGSPSPEQRRLRKRRHVIKELIDTEHTFGRDMTVVVDIYKATASSCMGVSPDDVKSLFGNSDQIAQFSLDFLDALKLSARSVYVLPRSQRWPPGTNDSRQSLVTTETGDSDQIGGFESIDDGRDRKTSIGAAFKANVAQMEKVYAEYVRNHESANRTLETLLRQTNASIWLTECREWASDLTTAWDLDSLLVKPVQRILKYPLLLTELLSATPPDHPDYDTIAIALRQTTAISVRINETKKRADVVGQVVKSGRKRKESDVRAGLSKAFGRRAEKLKQHVGLVEMFTDNEFDHLSRRFGDNFFQLQLIMRDVELYTREVEASMNKFSEFVVAIESYINVAPSNYPELESKWCRFRLAVKDILGVALVDHITAVRKHVIMPMITLLKLHDGPQHVMQKRNKRLMDYARYKAIKDRGDKPDKRITERGEQFTALNITLKEELPKLLSLTGRLMEACLNNLVQIQTTWLGLIQKKLGYTIERLPKEIVEIITDWSGDFSFSEAQVLSLGICNGSILAETVNLNNFGTTSASSTADASSSRRPSTVNSSMIRASSLEASTSPKVSQDFGYSSPHISVQSPPADRSHFQNVSPVYSDARSRANSSIVSRVMDAHEKNGHNVPLAPSTSTLNERPTTSNGTVTKPVSVSVSVTSPALPQLSLVSPTLRVFPPGTLIPISNGREPPNPADHPASPTAPRYSNIFSSALPMPDTSQPPTPADDHAIEAPKVLFLAASMFEFNIDRARREAGYPYLTYVAGEIFDVIAEKGDLWLARNQDDSTQQVGWIWTKHFAKLSI